MTPEKIEELELEALYSEKRDKLNVRLPIWSVLITLFGAFSYAGTQPGLAGYVTVFYPLLAGCVARFAGSSERILNRVKRRIYKVEEASGYTGYEHENANGSTGGSGTHIKALRDFVVLTDVISIIAVIARLVIDHMPPALIVVATLLETAAMIASCLYLHDKPAHQGEQQKQNTSVFQNEAIQEEAQL